MMTIKPIIKGVIAKNCNPDGCKQEVINQIQTVKSLKPIKNGPKKVLVLGCSSSLGLGSRISLAFGGNADTIGVSFERAPEGDYTGSAGWHNNIAFTEQAEKKGLIAKNFIGDAFSSEMRHQVIEYIKNEFGGQVDCVIYSLATGVRPKPEGDMWRSSIKAIGTPFSGDFINIEKGTMSTISIDVASEQEIEDTVKVMGGEDWAEWMQTLLDADVLANGVKTAAYSYIGSDVTYPIYTGGSLGRAKQHLHDSAEVITKMLDSVSGEARIGVCKSIVSKASVFIPGMSSYMLAILKLLKERGEYETCTQHMHRLMTDFMYHPQGTQVDELGLMRPDNIELNPEVQTQIKTMMEQINESNFTQPEFGDYQGFIDEFMRLNGFSGQDLA